MTIWECATSTKAITLSSPAFDSQWQSEATGVYEFSEGVLTDLTEKSVVWILAIMMMALAVVTPSSTVLAQAPAKTQVEILIDDGYPPFSYEIDGKPAGIYVEFLNQVFERIPDYHVSLRPVPWQRGKKMMETGSGFALAPAFFHGHDWPYLYPYSLPFYVETIRVFCRDSLLNEGSRRKWPDDFQNLSVGNVKGFDGWGGPKFRQLIARQKISYFEAPSSQALIKMGLAGRIDCLLMEETAFDIEITKIKRSSNWAGVSLATGPVSNSDPVYVGFSRPARERGKFPFMLTFMQALDSQIYQMQKSGDLRKIITAYKLKMKE